MKRFGICAFAILILFVYVSAPVLIEEVRIAYDLVDILRTACFFILQLALTFVFESIAVGFFYLDNADRRRLVKLQDAGLRHAQTVPEYY